MAHSAVMKEQLRRFWPIMPIMLFVYVIAVLLPIYSQSGSTYYEAQAVEQLFSMNNVQLRISTAFVPLIIVMFLFHPLFNTQAATAFRHYSENKFMLFWANMFAGFILMLVPLILVNLFILPHASPMAVVGFLVRISVSYTFYFAAFTLAVTLAGNAFMAVFLCVLIPVLPVLVYKLSLIIASLYVFGFTTASVADPLVILEYTNPIMQFESVNQINQGVLYITYTTITSVLLLAANTCFCLRKAEHAGNLIAFSVIKLVLVFILSVAGLVMLGSFTAMHITSRFFIFLYCVLGFVLAFVVAQMLVEKTFDIRCKLKPFLPVGGAACALYVILLLITSFGFTSYVNYVPQRTMIVGVHLSINEPWQPDDGFENNHEAITQVLTLHEWAVQRGRRSELRTAFWQATTGGGTQFANDGGVTVYITYALSNGNRVFRRYALPASAVEFFDLHSLNDIDDYSELE